jgi:hypothetical protein
MLTKVRYLHGKYPHLPHSTPLGQWLVHLADLN